MTLDVMVIDKTSKEEVAKDVYMAGNSHNITPTSLII